MAGVPYDGANSNDWDLYHDPAAPGDSKWYSTNPRWQCTWYNEIRELVHQYHPDLLYTDGGVPFGNEFGLSLIADFYNCSVCRQGARLHSPREAGEHADGPGAGHRHPAQVVYTCKQKSEGRWVEDVERGVLPGINPWPWQTDTSIGDWFYNRNWKFRPVRWTIHMLVDIVSKNGNLLLNVVQRPDGSLDPEVEQMLEELAAWTTVNGEAIYGTRPWRRYGEGPVQVKGGHFKEDFAYTAKDIRFTTKGATLYAIALGWPEDGRLLIRSLARSAGEPANRIQRVELLGHKGKLPFSQTADGLFVTLPAQPAVNYTCTLRITGEDLKPAGS